MSRIGGFCLKALALLVLLGFPRSTWAVRVAIVKSWTPAVGQVRLDDELNANWADFGEVRVVIDKSLAEVDSFTYDDLVQSGADVIWLRAPAFRERLYSPDEIAAIARYASEGHHLLGTFKVFQDEGADNTALAPLFGLPDVAYNTNTLVALRAFEILDKEHPLFRNVPDPYMTGGLPLAQTPADGSWDDGDFGAAQNLGITEDKLGVILWYETEEYHAVYVSELVELIGDPPDLQFIYNAVTIGAAPTGECCEADGTCSVVDQDECATGLWTEGGTCATPVCPPDGACCHDDATCSIGLEVACTDGVWTEAASCDVDSDDDGVADGCDRCPGEDDFVDTDADGEPDGCDRCEGFDDALDGDGDTVPDACDVCAGADDRVDTDGDAVADGCDICPGFDDGADCDDDLVPDGCDTEPDCNNNLIPDPCELRDGLADDCDGDSTPDDCQPDSDADGTIDACDSCFGDDALIGLTCDSPDDPDDCATGVYDCSSGILVCTDDATADDIDSDGDGVYDCNDQCPGTPPGVFVRPDGCQPTGACCFDLFDVCFDAVAIEDCGSIGGRAIGDGFSCDGDEDGDGTAGCADLCPEDGDKSEPGQCDCGRPDTDTDSDGTADCRDLCPDDPNKTTFGVCGCGVPDSDSDGDQTFDCHDDCPLDPDKVEPGLCGCGIADADSDGDQTPDCHDGCPDDPEKLEPGACGCGRPDIDSDGDKTLDCDDGCPDDPEKIEPGVCGCGTTDIDSDGDETFDCHDGCPADPEKIDPGICGCGVRDVDTDLDGVLDCHDLCPDTEKGESVDPDGCPSRGSCCFRPGICLTETRPEQCTLVGGTYQGNGSACAALCGFPSPGDFDFNGRIDEKDYAHWPGCESGPNAPFALDNCTVFDLYTNSTIDLRDFADFQILFLDTQD